MELLRKEIENNKHQVPEGDEWEGDIVTKEEDLKHIEVLEYIDSLLDKDGDIKIRIRGIEIELLRTVEGVNRESEIKECRSFYRGSYEQN